MQFLKAVWEEFEILQGMYEREFAEDTESSCTFTLDDDRRARNKVTLTVGEIFVMTHSKLTGKRKEQQMSTFFEIKVFSPANCLKFGVKVNPN